MTDPLESALFAFEDVLPDLEFVPLAARRALDLAGVRLTLEGWRSLGIPDRKALAMAGAPDDVDVDKVYALVRRAQPTPTRIAPAPDPDPAEPPEALVRALGNTRPLESTRWDTLRSLERYALMHGYRRAIAKGSPSQLETTFDAIIGPPKSPGRGGYVPPGAYSMNTPLDPRVPSPIGVMRRAPGEASPKISAKPSPAPPAPPPQTSPSGEPHRTTTLSSHLNAEGQIHMVGVGDKPTTPRRAVARGQVNMRRETAELVASGGAKKGEVLATARVAGILAAKRTPELVPLCHAVALTCVNVDLEIDAAGGRILVVATAEAVDRTGVEMEAMVAVSAACLTLYDMLKSTDREMEISSVLLVEKSGGKTGRWVRGERG